MTHPICHELMIQISKVMSLVLRHKPEEIGITLDEHGWANVDELINGLNKKSHPYYKVIDMSVIEEIVKTDKKQRYSFNEDKTLIRANQGHSIPVDVELEKVCPLFPLYHGTGEKSVESIDTYGLLPMDRLYVHLSGDIKTATNVGKRHGKPIVYVVDTVAMVEQGYTFYKSVNGVWLTKTVPAKFLKKIKKGE